MSDKLDTIIDSSVAAVVGLALLATFVIPTGIDFISSLTGNYAKYNSLLYVVLIAAIIVLIVGVIRFYSNKSR